jgi:hypothetical protein
MKSIEDRSWMIWGKGVYLSPRLLLDLCSSSVGSCEVNQLSCLTTITADQGPNLREDLPYGGDDHDLLDVQDLLMDIPGKGILLPRGLPQPSRDHHALAFILGACELR